jgi:hypothetical protein
MRSTMPRSPVEIRGDCIVTKPPQAKRQNKPSRDKPELDPDAWPRFEALVKNAAKMGHKPHSKAKKKR